MTNLKGIYEENGVWRVRKKYKGVSMSFTRPTQKEALYELKSRIKEIDDKIKLDISLEKTVEKLTMEDVFNEFIEAQGCKWKDDTLRFNRLLINNHFQSLKDIPISLINDKIITNWVIEIKKINSNKDGRELSNLPYRLSRLLFNILEFAIRKRYCSPLIDLSFVNNVSKVKTVSQKTSDNYINFQDFELLCDAITKMPEPPKAQRNEDMLFIIKFLYYTGLRIGEARAVQKKDIVKAIVKSSEGTKYSHYIDVYKQFGDNNYVLDNTLKCSTPCRKVGIVKEVYDEFMNYLEKNNYADENYIFDFKKEDKPLYRSVISNNIKRIIKLGKELKLLPEFFVDELSPHGFRYSNTIYLKYVLKKSVEVAARNQGHSVFTMQNTYTRIDRNDDFDTFDSDE